MSQATPTQGYVTGVLHDAIRDWSSRNPSAYVEPEAQELVEHFIAVAEAAEAAHALRNRPARTAEVVANLGRLLDASINARGVVTYDDIIKALASLCPLYPFC